MKIKLLLSFALPVFALPNLYSQDYETIPVNVRSTYLYKIGADSLFKHFHSVLDTVVAGNTSYKSYRSMDDDVHTFSTAIFPWFMTDSTWLGYRMIKLGSGNEVFLNEQLDSIHFKNNIQLNDKWRLYQYANGDYIQATLSSIQHNWTLGVSDSVRVINLQLYDSANQTLSHGINSIQFEISKEYGFTKLINLRHFPSDLNYYVLGGVESPALGKYNLDAKTIYNYEIGDLFQYEEGSYSVDVFWKFYEQRTVIDKQVFLGGDSIVYLILDSTLRVSDYTSPSPYTTYSLSINVDTCILYNNKYSSFFDPYNTPNHLNKLTYKVDIQGADSGDTIVLQRKSYIFNNRLRKEFHLGCADPTPLHPNFLSECTPTPFRCKFSGISYIEGVGIDRYLDNISACIQCCYKNLVFYEKGIEQWGTRFRLQLILDANELSKSNNVVVSPNPFNQTFRISNLSSDNNEITVFDNLGNKVAEYNSEHSEYIDIHTEGFSAGVYFLHISNLKTVQSIKLIKID